MRTASFRGTISLGFSFHRPPTTENPPKSDASRDGEKKMRRSKDHQHRDGLGAKKRAGEWDSTLEKTQGFFLEKQKAKLPEILHLNSCQSSSILIIL